jgi:hypothetical protein
VQDQQQIVVLVSGSPPEGRALNRASADRSRLAIPFQLTSMQVTKLD